MTFQNIGWTLYGHKLGSDVGDTCPAILQGLTCRNDN